MNHWRLVRRDAQLESWMHRAMFPVSVRSWVSNAACSTVELDLFFAKKHRAAAIAMCEACQVRMDCLRDTIQVEAAGNIARDCQGVRAGFTAAERVRIHQMMRVRPELVAA